MYYCAYPFIHTTIWNSPNVYYFIRPYANSDHLIVVTLNRTPMCIHVIHTCAYISNAYMKNVTKQISWAGIDKSWSLNSTHDDLVIDTMMPPDIFTTATWCAVPIKITVCLDALNLEMMIIFLAPWTHNVNCRSYSIPCQQNIP